MSVSKSKTKTKSSPYAAAVPAIDNGLSSAQGTLSANQPLLQKNSQLAQDAFTKLAPTAFGNSPFVSGAMDAASKVFSGGYMGNSPSADTYKSLQSTKSPATDILSQLAQGSKSPGSYDNIGTGNPGLGLLSGMTNQNNPASGILKGMTSQQVNGDSKQFYQDTLNGKYLNNNPYIDAIVKQSGDSATRAVNSRFAATGMGAGISTPYADLLTKNVTDSENGLRYGAYNDELQRMGQIGGQSDSQYNATRDRELSAANSFGTVSGQDMDRNLSAAQNLGLLSNQTDQLRLNAQGAKDGAFQNDRSSQLAAAQSLGTQGTADNTTRLNAATAADNQSNDQVSQILQALGLTGNIANAQYAGVDPALNLLKTSSAIPYAGLGSYADILNSLSGNLGTKTTTGNPSLLDSIGQGVSIAGDAVTIGKKLSDRRLKQDITRLGTLDNGLPVYSYRYVWGGPTEIGVMADEVATMRPEALGPSVAGYSSVDYGAL